MVICFLEYVSLAVIFSSSVRDYPRRSLLALPTLLLIAIIQPHVALWLSGLYSFLYPHHIVHHINRLMFAAV
jgi:hypothetical protein